VVEHDELHACALIAFRDKRRAEPGLRADYAGMKKQLGRRYRKKPERLHERQERIRRSRPEAGRIDLPGRDALPE